jgi:hypothetical protein
MHAIDQYSHPLYILFDTFGEAELNEESVRVGKSLGKALRLRLRDIIFITT